MKLSLKFLALMFLALFFLTEISCILRKTNKKNLKGKDNVSEQSDGNLAY